ncbi:hypothetical protein WME90_12280 [Sorangium sp. So ce375]|uniref:hypothetical protein n=1 Tax=Sorangium sp. So ce375 TaxID=3133306 RepID=UPI003F5BD2AE
MASVELAETIYGRWLELRAADVFDEVLPRAKAYRSVTSEGEVFGYDTCEHQVRRRVVIPGSGPVGGDSVVGLVETYFAVRHSNGWGHNLHVHLVEVKDESLQLSHFAQLFRDMAALRNALQVVGVSSGVQARKWLHRNLYVHGALLGPSASGEVLVTEAMLDKLYDHLDNGYTQPPIRVGCVSIRSKRVIVKRIDPAMNYSFDQWDRNQKERERAKQVIHGLLGASPMWSEWVESRQAEQRPGNVPQSDEHELTQRELNGRREASLRLLTRIGFTLTDADRERIRLCEDAASLDKCIEDILGVRNPSSLLS